VLPGADERLPSLARPRGLAIQSYAVAGASALSEGAVGFTFRSFRKSANSTSSFFADHPLSGRGRLVAAMPKPPPPSQPILDLSAERRSPKESYAEALKLAEREYREAQAAVGKDDSNENRARYARALYEYQQLERMLPFTGVIEAEGPKA
jgi:hypothetical protein